MPYNSRANKGTPMIIQESIEQLSSAVVTNGDSIIKILELMNKQNKKKKLIINLLKSINYKKNSKDSNLNSND
jgi:hypothetical protein